MDKRYGTVTGGTEITFTGVGFTEADDRRFLGGSEATASVFIDGRNCEVTSQTDTEITCTTSNKPDSEEDPSLEIFFEGIGNVATKGKLFRYVKRWSDKLTWGGNLPRHGDVPHIPKGMHVLFDLEKSPVYSLVLVEGSLIFDQETAKKFDAEYILVKEGYLEIGTEDEPYTGELTITMHGTEFGGNLPTFGNKVLAVKGGQLEMHGARRDIAWTDLKTTADVKAKEITLNDIPNDKTFDWKVGDKIVIASTDFEGRHAEERTISGIRDADESNPIIEFEEELQYKHFADTETYDGESIEMRAEVGLLSRNVVFQGDSNSLKKQYGAHIMLSPTNGKVNGKIENIELTNVGQAFKLGRYPIHFHLSGNVNGSYIRNNAIHTSFNRGITVHAVN